MHLALKKWTRKWWDSSAARSYNRRLVANNQKSIVDACQGVSRIALVPKSPLGEGGSVEHYYHFLFDLLMPLLLLGKKLPEHFIVELEEVGPFMKSLPSLCGDLVSLCTSEEFTNKENKHSLLGMNPKAVRVDANELKSFRDGLLQRFDIKNVKPDIKRVLLIERQPPEAYFKSKECRVKGGGSERRSISNHDDLMRWLEDNILEPFEFENIQLEKCSFKDQMSLFNGASLVIAQHGAALANIIWMQGDAQVIEIGNDTTATHFKLIAGARGIAHSLYPVDEAHCEIDFKDFSQWIGAHKELDKFFKTFSLK